MRGSSVLGGARHKRGQGQWLRAAGDAGDGRGGARAGALHRVVHIADCGAAAHAWQHTSADVLGGAGHRGDAHGDLNVALAASDSRRDRKVEEVLGGDALLRSSISAI